MDLQEPEPYSVQRDGQEHGSESIEGFSKTAVLTEVKQHLALAGPIVSVNFMLFFLHVISIMVVGRLGELALSSASLGSAFASIAGYTLLRGIGSTLETFSGQSFGAKQYRMLGIHLQRGMIIVLLMSIPIAVLFAHAADILKIFRQDRQISDGSGMYARFLIPGLFAIAVFECCIRFLQAQNNVVPLMISSGIGTSFHAIFCWILVFKSSLEYKGAALSLSMSVWINVVLVIAYVLFSPSCKETWKGFSKEALRGITTFLKLAIPSTIMLSLEVWSLEMMILLSGLLPNPELETSVLSISFNIYLLVHGIPVGFAGAVSTRVSNELGAGRPRTARLAACVAVTMVATEGIIAAVVIISGHKVLGCLYTEDRRVVKSVGEMLPWVAASHFLDGVQSVLSGTCRGCGLQKVGAFINLGSYYFIGIPTMIVLAFISHIGGKGLWMGFTVALLIQACLLCIITLLTNWEKQAMKAKHRVFSSMVIPGGTPS